MNISFAVRFFKYLAMILAFRIRNTRAVNPPAEPATVDQSVPVITVSQSPK